MLAPRLRTSAAENLTIEDPGGYFNSTDIEDVLQEIITRPQNIWIPAGAFVSVATNGAAISKYEFPNNDSNIDYAAFDGNTQEFVDFNIVMPERWNRSTIKFKFHWLIHDVPAAGTGVEWGITGVAKGNTDLVDAAYGTQVFVSGVYAALDTVYITSATSALTIAGSPANGDLVNFKIARNISSGNDDLNGDAWLLGVDMQYLETSPVIAW